MHLNGFGRLLLSYTTLEQIHPDRDVAPLVAQSSNSARGIHPDVTSYVRHPGPVALKMPLSASNHPLDRS